MHPFDRVTVNGNLVGLSTWIGYSANEGKMLTLGVIDERHAAPGTEVTFVWGEPGGGTTKPAVERHKQVEIKAVVSPVPYSAVADTQSCSKLFGSRAVEMDLELVTAFRMEAGYAPGAGQRGVDGHRQDRRAVAVERVHVGQVQPRVAARRR